MLALMKTQAGPGNLALKEIREPSPAQGQVMIEVEAAGICASDLHIRDWDIKLNLKPPVVIGHEFAGRVAKLGEGVEEFQVDQRVTSETAFSVCGHCIPCKNGEYNACTKKELIGYVHNGCFTRNIVVPAERVHLIPENVDTVDAAICEPLAAVVRGVVELTVINPGDLVVVAGPGPIGLLALQVAMVAGGKVLICGTDGDEKRLSLAEELGADRIINVQKEDLLSTINSMGYNEGADVYLECSGSPASVRDGLEVLRRRGQFTQIGLPGAPFELEFSKIAYKELIIHGSLGQRWNTWRIALKLIESGQVNTRKLMNREFPLSEWEQAFSCFENREGIKVVLKP